MILCGFVITFFIFISFTFVSAQTINRSPPIKIGTDLWIPNFLTYIAQEKGYFKKNNVDVSITLIPLYGSNKCIFK
jgi:hypothetical protein